MTTDLKKATLNELLSMAAEALDDAYDKMSGVPQEQYDLVQALRDRSKDLSLETDLSQPKDLYNPGKG